jgi:hypothetical protein
MGLNPIALIFIGTLLLSRSAGCGGSVVERRSLI